MNYTDYLNLNLPEGNEFFNRTHQNDNMEKIDQELSDQNDAIAEKASKDVATSSSDGLMSKEDKSKVDGIESGANKTVVDSSLSTTSTNPVQNKVVTTEINTHKSSSVVSADGVHGFKVDASDKKAYAMIDGQWVEIAGGGATQSTVLNISTTATTELNGKKIGLYTSDDEKVKESTFSNGQAVMESDLSLGTYTLKSEGYSLEFNVTEKGSTINLNFDNAIALVTFTIEGAKGDDIGITGNGITEFLVDFGTSTTGTASNFPLTPLLNGKTFTFTSKYIAKDTTAGTNAYSRTNVISKATTSVKCMPDGALYWYGNKADNSHGELTCYASRVGGYNTAVAPSVSFSPTNYFTLTHTSNVDGRGMIAYPIAFNKNSFSKAKIFLKKFNTTATQNSAAAPTTSSQCAFSNTLDDNYKRVSNYALIKDETDITTTTYTNKLFEIESSSFTSDSGFFTINSYVYKGTNTIDISAIWFE